MDRQHQVKRLAGILFIAVLPLLNHAYGADKNTRQTSPDGDEGYFGGGSPGNTNAMILWPRDGNNIVRKYRPAGSAAGSPLAFKLWVDPGRSGGFPVNLKTPGAFCGFLQNIDNDPDKSACICEDDPHRSYTGAPLAACAGVNFPACNPVACAPGTTEEPEETKETCLEPIPPETEWTSKMVSFNARIFRARNLYTTCVPYTYTRCGKQEKAEVCGEMDPKPCTEDPWDTGEWQPETEPALICKGKTVTQTRRVSLHTICDYQDRYPQPKRKRTITGVKTDGECAPPEPCTERSWTADPWSGKEAAQICLGTTETQTRTVTKTDRRCVGGTPPQETRQVAGTKTTGECAPGGPCRRRDWSPRRSSVCAGEALTQTRAYCQNGRQRHESRRVTGAKYCPPPDPEPVAKPKCQWTTGTWTPGRSTVCTGEPFTQSRNVRKITAYCEGGAEPVSSRSTTGTKYCRPPNPPGPGPVSRPECRWTTGTWTPGRNTVCAGEPFTQTRSVRKITTNCQGGTAPASSRSATGTKNCPPTCRWRAGSWSPSPATTCSDQRVSQSRSVTKITANCVGGTQPASTRTVSGSKRCPNCTPTSWSPRPNTVCAGGSFTQTRTLKNCSNDSRNARGTKCCGTVTGWSPSPAGKCGTFTQTRTNACGKTESRSAKGTASWCGCSWGAYAPSPATVCKGKTFTQKSYYSCSGRTNKPRTRTASGTKSCPKACRDGQSYCSAYTRYLCRNGKWKVIAQGPYACFTP